MVLLWTGYSLTLKIAATTPVDTVADFFTRHVRGTVWTEHERIFLWTHPPCWIYANNVETFSTVFHDPLYLNIKNPHGIISYENNVSTSSVDVLRSVSFYVQSYSMYFQYSTWDHSTFGRILLSILYVGSFYVQSYSTFSILSGIILRSVVFYFQYSKWDHSTFSHTLCTFSIPPGIILRSVVFYIQYSTWDHSTFSHTLQYVLSVFYVGSFYVQSNTTFIIQLYVRSSTFSMWILLSNFLDTVCLIIYIHTYIYIYL